MQSRIATYYDLIHTAFDDDVALWDTLAQEAGGPILEVGCGTGRLMLPLASAGYPITGLDLSSAALEICRAKLRAADLAVPLYEADMRTFDLPEKNFALAGLGLNTFMHCASQDDQLATLTTVHQHLRPDGLLLVDVFQPDPQLMTESDGRLYYEADLTHPTTGHTVQWYWRQHFDLAEQVRYLTYLLDDIDAAGLVRRVQLELELRYVYRYEMELLLRYTGFDTPIIYGDYDFSPYDSHSPRMIFVASKA